MFTSVHDMKCKANYDMEEIFMKVKRRTVKGTVDVMKAEPPRFNQRVGFLFLIKILCAWDKDSYSDVSLFGRTSLKQEDSFESSGYIPCIRHFIGE